MVSASRSAVLGWPRWQLAAWHIWGTPGMVATRARLGTRGMQGTADMPALRTRDRPATTDTLPATRIRTTGPTTRRA
ncbi:MAG: hypothetical protein ABIP93_04475 [Gemmatimonadaceae bacterium]